MAITFDDMDARTLEGYHWLVRKDHTGRGYFCNIVLDGYNGMPVLGLTRAGIDEPTKDSSPTYGSTPEEAFEKALAGLKKAYGGVLPKAARVEALN